MAGRLVDYIGSGLAAALPAAATIDAALTPDAAGFFYATDTQTLYCLDRSGTPSWDTIVTGGAAMTLATTVTQSGTPAATSVGFLGSPQMADQDDYTLALTDAGGHYYHVSATPHTLTIPENGSIAFPIGTVIGIVNENGAGAVSIVITTDTLRWGSSTGTRTLAANGTATLIKVTSTVWRLTGDGIT